MILLATGKPSWNWKGYAIQPLTDKKTVLFRRTETSFSLESDYYRVYWEGFVFISGVLSGEESVKVFIEKLNRTNISETVHLLRGTYFFLIEEKSSGDCYAFVDNSGLYQAFYTDNVISTSFLELIKYYKYKVTDFDPDAVVEFLYFGFLFFDKTFIKSISRIPREKILFFSKRGGIIHSIAKEIPDINQSIERGSEYFDEVFSGAAASLKNCKVSIDLTGGADSRLIALLLNLYGLNFEAAVAGGTEDYDEIMYSRKVASSLQLPWHRSIHSLSSLIEDFVELFHVTDGLSSLLDYHCMFKLQKARFKRGIDTVISGAGGDFYKDVFWLQDFPFYFKKSANITRLVDTRIMTYDPVDSLLTEDYSDLHRELRSKIIKGLYQYHRDSNTRTYDNICFNLIMRDFAGRDLTNHSFYMKAYAPFLDLDIVRIGIGLPVSMRIFNKFHRKKLTKLNPLLAGFPSTEGGMSASSEPMQMLSDVPKYMSNRINRLFIKMNLRKRPETSYNHPDFYDAVRKMAMMKDSVETLKEAGIVSQKTRIEEIDNVHLGTFLSLGILVNYTNDTV